MSNAQHERAQHVRPLVEDPVTRGILWLVHNGVPFSVAENLTAFELEAWSIIFSEFNGGVYDWSRMQWKDQT